MLNIIDKGFLSATSIVVTDMKKAWKLRYPKPETKVKLNPVGKKSLKISDSKASCH